VTTPQLASLVGVLPHHLAHLRASGLSDATITAAGIRSETSPEALAALLGWRRPSKGLAPAIVFPFVDSQGRNGYARVRPDTPRTLAGKSVKYESPRGLPNQVYIPPGVARVLADPGAELLITEGEKKGLAATQAGFPSLGLVGIYGWKEKRGEHLLPELERAAWQGRPVYIVFDSDLAANPDVRLAEARLAKHLADRGAVVRCARLPDGPPDANGEPVKVGLDDYLMSHGPAELRKLLDAAIDPEPLSAADCKADARSIDAGVEAKAHLAATAIDDIPTLRFWLGDWWCWRRGAYRRREAAYVRASLLRSLDLHYRRINSGIVSNVLDHVRAWSILDADLEPGTWLVDDPKKWNPADVLATANELIHLPTLTRRPATPKLFTTAALEFDFHSAPPRPDEWLAFLDKLWGADHEAIATLQDFFGLLLTPDTSHHKILLLIGPPRSGKGTLGRVIRSLVGHANVAGPTLAGLATNFGLEPLLGKSVAIVSDARLGGKSDSAVVVERLLSISGEDALTIDRKHTSAVTAKLPTRIVILSNELPRLADTSGAMASRFVVLRLTESFLGKEDTSLFEAKLRPELPAILWWAIAGWQRLRARGYFVQPESGRELTNAMADLTSPIGAFVRERCVVAGACSVERSELYAAYRSWAEVKGRQRIEDEAGFGRGLRAAVPSVQNTRPREGGERVNRYSGIELS
jgi:putative DNA primase/helicase